MQALRTRNAEGSCELPPDQQCSISSVVVATHPTPHLNRELKCLAL
jgi:hypothetical protein